MVIIAIDNRATPPAAQIALAICLGFDLKANIIRRIRPACFSQACAALCTMRCAYFRMPFSILTISLISIFRVFGSFLATSLKYLIWVVLIPFTRIYASIFAILVCKLMCLFSIALDTKRTNTYSLSLITPKKFRGSGEILIAFCAALITFWQRGIINFRRLQALLTFLALRSQVVWVGSITEKVFSCSGEFFAALCTAFRGYTIGSHLESAFHVIRRRSGIRHLRGVAISSPNYTTDYPSFIMEDTIGLLI